jgi:hypothetical protein
LPVGSTSRGWALRQHQADLIEAGQRRASTLLIAPTGAGKTLAGFLPSLIDLHHIRTTRPRNPQLPNAGPDIRPEGTGQRGADRRMARGPQGPHGPAHALHFAAEGAGGGHRPQS